MNDVDRAECEDVWREAVRAGEICDERHARGFHCYSDEYPSKIDILLAAKRKWENAKLEEAAQKVGKDIINAAGIRALKQE